VKRQGQEKTEHKGTGFGDGARDKKTNNKGRRALTSVSGRITVMWLLDVEAELACPDMHVSIEPQFLRVQEWSVSNKHSHGGRRGRKTSSESDSHLNIEYLMMRAHTQAEEPTGEDHGRR
jgi:hypothetical protein